MHGETVKPDQLFIGNELLWYFTITALE